MTEAPNYQPFRCFLTGVMRCLLGAPQFLSEVEAWCKVCSEGGLPSEMQELELAIHRHQSLYEQVTQAYTEVRPQQPPEPAARLPGATCGGAARDEFPPGF